MRVALPAGGTAVVFGAIALASSHPLPALIAQTIALAAAVITGMALSERTPR